jgi:hypothetical protein
MEKTGSLFEPSEPEAVSQLWEILKGDRRPAGRRAR